MSSSSEVDNSIVHQPKIKHDWYQTEQQVVIQVLQKNVDGTKVKVSFTKTTLTLELPSNEGSIVNMWVLANEIIPEKSMHKVSPTKVEVRLVKAEGIHWSELENEVQKKKSFGRNWDKVVKELKDDAPEGEEALSALFQKIYEEGSDDVKKAMNKSFLESGGTELNTNWDSVRKDRVSIKPPDGMEWKSWDQ